MVSAQRMELPSRTTGRVSSGQVSAMATGKEGGAASSQDQEKLFLDHERQDLPYYHEQRALPFGSTQCTVRLADARYEELSAVELSRLPGLGSPGPEPELRVVVGVERKRPKALIDLYPYRTNPASGRIERLVAYTLQVAGERGGGVGAPKSGVYPEHSKLAGGEWFRFQVAREGVYKLDHAFLQQLGLPMAGLASDRINVYGNHAGVLPTQNGAMPPTDMLCNAVEVVDGGDGQLDPGDHILFFASGPDDWVWSETLQRFVHTKNTYTDSATYFIGLDIEPAKRIAGAELSAEAATDVVTAFSDRQFIDRDLVNLLKSGRTWYGETFDITTTYNYSFQAPFIRSAEPTCLTVDVLSRTIGVSNSSQWQVNVAGQTFNFNDAGVSGNYAGAYADSSRRTFCFTAVGNNLPVSVTFNKSDPISSLGWMNYLELNTRRDLTMSGDQLLFRDPSTVGAGRVSEFILAQAGAVERIWEVTDPVSVGRVDFTVDGTAKRFRVAADGLRQFIAFRNTGYLEPTPVGRVAPQDLHATAIPTELVIVCPPQFWSEAQRLADRRADEGLSVVMVTPQQIYNEFSSGQRDATAIKRYMKMLYDRAGADSTLFPRYLLLFGDGSYNNYNLSDGNQNLIPSFQSVNSWIPSQCYTTDDYYCLLDDNEGEALTDIVDAGVGRIPVSNGTQAREMVDKILNYDKFMLQSSTGSSCATGSDGGASDWRNWVLFASDDQSGDGFEGTIHMLYSDELANTVEQQEPCLNIAKVYLDAYVQESTPGGQRYPEAEVALRDRVQKGLLLVNYIGHGGEVGWAHERLLDNQTILGWSNLDRLPLFMTATCEFTRWDDPARTSAGEWVLLNPNGGGIALMTTTRIAYSGANQALARRFFAHVFETVDEQGRAERFGDIYRRTKADVSTSGNNYRNFCLLGDPSIRLALARNSARITAVTDTLGNAVDTLKALATVRIAGEVLDDQGQVMTGFNGVVVPTVFDKESNVSTLANDGGGPFNYQLRRNIIYRGKASVVDGRFAFTFVVPKDINYQVGPGRVSVYAESLGTNACGYDNGRPVGASDPNAVADDAGPRIDLFMNDERFVAGGTTNEDPLLLAKLFDENGINTLGNSIGHDLTAVIDGNTENAIVLNDVYQADLNTYRSGQVRYRLNDLAEGTHTLDLKAWDVHNNSSTRSLEFVVAASAELALERVLNYPNPFTTRTEFYFEHNRPCGELDVQVQVFTVTGRLVKTLGRRLACEGFRSEPLAWDGLDDQGDKLGRGVYVYRLSIANEAGEAADKVEKLVILR
jgi:hypothetical protein